MMRRSSGRGSASRKSSRSIAYLVKVLSQLNHRAFQALLQPFDLTPFHWLVLRCLWEKDGLPVSEITESLQEVGGTMTGVLDRMEDRELVTRVRDSADRRVLRIFLTKKGQELEQELMPLVERHRKRLVKGIAQSDLSMCEKVMGQLIDNCQVVLKDG